jgi:hypothetical protein
VSALLVVLANIFFLPFGIRGLFALELITLFLLLGG